MTRNPLLVLIVLLCGCAPSTDPAPDQPAVTATPGLSGTGEAPGPAAAASNAQGRQANMGQGTNTVFGLELLPGMTPAPGPNKVYRFVGVYPLEQLADYVRDKTMCNNETKEHKGYLFRDAVAKTKTSASGINPRLGIRVSRNPAGGGARLDVWLEKGAAVSAKPGRSRRTPGARSAGSAGSAAPRRGAMSPRQEKALGDTLRVMRKLERGEKLNEQDRKSSYFQ